MAADFKALVLEETGGKISASIQRVANERLPEGDVTVRVTHSTLNYKDGMILKGLGRLVRAYPHVPGVDFAGTVEESRAPGFASGDAVVLTGWRVGENRWGGYAERARVKGEWLVRLPKGLDAAGAMAVGTAGFTAMLAIDALERHGLKPGDGELLVTGAAGGVGSIAVALLAALGYRVAASTGRPAEADWLKSLGAAVIVERAELSQPPAKPLLSERWAGCVDAVGGNVLASVLAQLRYRGAVAACGLAGGNSFPGSVVPFLLRGVALLGIDSVMAPREQRGHAWMRIAELLPAARLAAIATHAKLEDLPALAEKILAGQVRGRIVVDIP